MCCQQDNQTLSSRPEVCSTILETQGFNGLLALELLLGFMPSGAQLISLRHVLNQTRRENWLRLLHWGQTSRRTS